MKELTKEQEDQLINCGVFDYDSEKIANIINVDKKIIEKAFSDPNSKISKLWHKGKDISDYVIDLKLFEMAKSGDIKALEKLDARKRQRS
jgi:hypothetical protein